MKICAVRFNSLSLLIYVRVVQLLLVVFSLSMLPQKSEGLLPWGFPLLMIIFQIAALGFVQAEVTDQGISYRRWVAWKLISWNEVEGISQNTLTKQMVLRAENRPVWRRYLILCSPKCTVSDTTFESLGVTKLQALLGSELL